MEETYTLEAVVLNRFSFREYDSKVILYSREHGKLELVARGTKRTKSKIAGHIEPMNLIEGMAIRGRQFDYLGSAISRDCFRGVKDDLEKVMLVGKAVSLVNQSLRPGIADERIFEIISEYLNLANAVNYYKTSILTSAFIIKFLSLLGYRPELYSCVICRQKITPTNNHFSVYKGGLVCANCAKKSSGSNAITDDCIKIWRLSIESSLTELAKVSINEKLNTEFRQIANLYFKYTFDNITK